MGTRFKFSIIAAGFTTVVTLERLWLTAIAGLGGARLTRLALVTRIARLVRAVAALLFAFGAESRTVVATSGGRRGGGAGSCGFPVHRRTFRRLRRKNLQFRFHRLLVGEHRFGGLRNLGGRCGRGRRRRRHLRLRGFLGPLSGVEGSGRLGDRGADNRSGRRGSGLRGRLVDRGASDAGLTRERVFVFALGGNDLDGAGLIAGRRSGGGRGGGAGTFAPEETGTAGGAKGWLGCGNGGGRRYAGGLRGRRSAGGQVGGGLVRRA